MRDLVWDTRESSTVLKAVGSHVRSYLQSCFVCKVPGGLSWDKTIARQPVGKLL